MNEVAQASSLQALLRASWKLVLLLVTALFVGGHPAGATIPEDIVRQSYELSPTASLSIRNTDGRIYIYGAEAPRLEIWAMRRAFTKERMEAIKIAVTIEGDTAVIETIYPPASGGFFVADRSGTVDYMILVPQTCTLSKVELANGEVLIQGVNGSNIEAQLDKGLLHLYNCFSAAHLSLGQGKLDVSYAWWEPRTFSLSAEVKDGDLRAALPVSAALHLEAAAPRGHIVNDFATELHRDLQVIDEHFGGESAVEFKLRTTDGDIRLERVY